MEFLSVIFSNFACIFALIRDSGLLLFGADRESLIISEIYASLFMA